MFENAFNGLFGKIAPGMCRLSMSGKVAVKTNGGYKAFDVKTGKLTNCDNFVLPVGDDFFFCIPTNKVAVGDIILVNGKPRCVLAVEKESIKVVNYEDSTVDNILPERHEFMGNTYFYGKIVSMLGDTFGKSSAGTKNLFKYMMLSEMFKGSGSGMSGMLPFALMGGGNMFGDVLQLDSLFNTDEEETAEDTEEE